MEFHKGFTFPRRRSISKVYKDLYGIWYVATQLNTFSETALTELLNLKPKHSKWFKKFQENLHQWVDNATPIDWVKLETQDPFGKLKKLNFEYMLKTMGLLSVV